MLIFGEAGRFEAAAARWLLTAVSGKSCGECSLCCYILEIEELSKPAGPPCPHCRREGGCGVYATRASICRDFECLWLSDRKLPRPLRPDKIGTLFMEAHDVDEYRAVCAPERPLAWRQPRVFAHLVAMAKSGRTVVAKAGLSSWRIFSSGDWGPTV